MKEFEDPTAFLGGGTLRVGNECELGGGYDNGCGMGGGQDNGCENGSDKGNGCPSGSDEPPI